MIVECTTCGELKESSPTPEGDDICTSCGDKEMLEYCPTSNCCDAAIVNPDVNGHGKCYECKENCTPNQN